MSTDNKPNPYREKIQAMAKLRPVLIELAHRKAEQEKAKLPVSGLPPNSMAWSPLRTVMGLKIGGISLPKTQPLPLDIRMYLSFLTDRLQRLVNEDPENNAQTLAECLEVNNLWEDQVKVVPEDAASTLILSNPAVRQRLHLWGLLSNLNQTPVNLPELQQALLDELDDPPDALEGWVAAISIRPR